MMRPISDFCCKPQSEEEAREIVERAVAHGAELCESVARSEGVEYGWSEYPYWGVCDGDTITGRWTFEYSGIEHLTLDQLRKRAPFVGELTPNAKAWATFDNNRPFSGMTEHEWQAARRALHFAGMLTNGERSEGVNEKEQIGQTGHAIGEDLVCDEMCRQALMNRGVTKETADKIVEIRRECREGSTSLGSEEYDHLLEQDEEEVSGKHQDEVNNPSHYASGDIECIDAIQASMSQEEFEGYCKGNVMKYMWRWRDKGGRQSLEKAQWYLNKMLEVVK